MTHYGLDGRVETQWRQDFLHPSRPTLGPYIYIYACVYTCACVYACMHACVTDFQNHTTTYYKTFVQNIFT
jgi:hypothetical protein